MPLDLEVWYELCAHDFDGEGECFPAEATIAAAISQRLKRKVWRESVCRSIKRLRLAEKIRLKERRPGRRGWWHNVYEILEFALVSTAATSRIVRRAHKRRPHPQLLSVIGSWRPCRCTHCREEKSGIGRAPPRLKPLTKVQRIDLEFFGEHGFAPSDLVAGRLVRQSGSVALLLGQVSRNGRAR
jgi:hypothetical protein